MVDIPSILLESGAGAVLGVISGYAAKLFAKIIVIIIGIEVALFKFLEAKGVLTVDWGALSTAAGNATREAGERTSEAQGYLMSILEVLPVGAGFVGGAFLGWKLG